ncbi:MAG TPA: helix-turn-helix domain-containing protein [Gemmatimonadales bacterium]|nr:helix-turn-helix domain-containing protein [Gemmatimonadales bacterium]
MNPLHLLILDDDPARRQELAALVRAAGHVAVPEANAGVAAQGLLPEAGDATPGFDLLVVDLRHPGVDLGTLRSALAPGAGLPPDSLDAAERRHILSVLKHTGGNRRQAAHILGIARSTLLSKLRRYGSDPE